MDGVSELLTHSRVRVRVRSRAFKWTREDGEVCCVDVRRWYRRFRTTIDLA